MKILHIVAWVLLIIGGLNWGLVGAFDTDLVAKIFGAGTAISRLIYILVGLSAIWGIYAYAVCKECSINKNLDDR